MNTDSPLQDFSIFSIAQGIYHVMNVQVWNLLFTEKLVPLIIRFSIFNVTFCKQIYGDFLVILSPKANNVEEKPFTFMGSCEKVYYTSG